jgi:hypothetical protein
MLKYTEGTIRRKALEAGYEVKKSFTRYNYNGAIVRDDRGGGKHTQAMQS